MFILRKIFSYLIDTIQTFLFAASIFLAVYMFLFRPFQVSGTSMYPNFYDKEYVLTNLIVLRFENPKKGDVVVFKSPTDPEKDFIKRIIAVPGDYISVRNGVVFINNTQLNESGYLSNEIKTIGGSFLKEGDEITVPQDSYFVLGDNRPYSSDSREWGFVKHDEILGESFVVYWPLSRVRIIKNPFID